MLPVCVGVGVMCVDAGQVLKRAVLCRRCNEDYLFTLRAIAEQAELRCPACGHSIAIRDHAYEPLVSHVRNVLTAMDSVPTYFMSPRQAEYGRSELK
jgi:DNA-directed RNA polymerase subunit RPC12/RpoP